MTLKNKYTKKSLTHTNNRCPFSIYEISRYVAKFLTKRDLISCVCVSKDWSYWFAPFAWETIQVKTLPAPTMILKHALRHHGNLIRNLSIQCCASNLSYHCHSVSISTLVFDRPWIESLTTLDIVVWKSIERQCLNIIHRNSTTLRELRFGYKIMDWLRGYDLPLMPNLQVLELFNCKLTKTRIRKLVQAKCPAIEAFGLNSVELLSDSTIVPTRSRVEQYSKIELLPLLATKDSSAQRQRQQRRPVNSILEVAKLGLDEEKYLPKVNILLIRNKVYPILDLFPNLECIKFRPSDRSTQYKNINSAYELNTVSNNIKTTCLKLSSIVVETYPPSMVLFPYIIKSIHQLTHFEMGYDSTFLPSIVRETLDRHFSTLEVVQVDFVWNEPSAILLFLERCPRLRKWSCSPNVSFMPGDLAKSLSTTKLKTTGWVCMDIEELSWPKDLGRLTCQDIEIEWLLSSLVEQHVQSCVRHVSEPPKKVETTEHADQIKAQSSGKIMNGEYELLLQQLILFKKLKSISFGSKSIIFSNHS